MTHQQSMETKSGKETITTSDVIKMYDTCRKRPDNKIKLDALLRVPRQSLY